MAILEAFMVVRGGFGVSEGGWVVGRVGGWSDAGPPSRGGWVVGRDGDSYQRVHVGKHTQPSTFQCVSRSTSAEFLRGVGDA